MTELRLLVLGLLYRKPRSAYAIGQALGQMPAANFSGSPGAVYPAIKAMQADGLVEHDVHASESARGQILRPTAKGREVVVEWLESPLSGWDLVRAPGSALLRLSFLEDQASRERFRTRVLDASSRLMAELDQYAESAEADLAASSAESIRLTRSILQGYLTWAQTHEEDGDPKR